MPKITDYTEATELTADTVLMGVQNGEDKRIPASLVGGGEVWELIPYSPPGPEPSVGWYLSSGKASFSIAITSEYDSDSVRITVPMIFQPPTMALSPIVGNYLKEYRFIKGNMSGKDVGVNETFFSKMGDMSEIIPSGYVYRYMSTFSFVYGETYDEAIGVASLLPYVKVERLIEE